MTLNGQFGAVTIKGEINARQGYSVRIDTSGNDTVLLAVRPPGEALRIVKENRDDRR